MVRFTTFDMLRKLFLESSAKALVGRCAGGLRECLAMAGGGVRQMCAKVPGSNPLRGCACAEAAASRDQGDRARTEAVGLPSHGRRRAYGDSSIQKIHVCFDQNTSRSGLAPLVNNCLDEIHVFRNAGSTK